MTEQSAVVLVDTSILLNVLRVPNRSDQFVEVMARLKSHIEANDQLLLPIATIIETGNHIAHNGNGDQRRRCGTDFVKVVRQAAEQSVPWAVAHLPESPAGFAGSLEEFPDLAMRQVGFGDLTIIKAWHAACARFQGWRVAIWSLDDHLKGYDRAAQI